MHALPRIEPVEWFVEQHERWFVHQRGRQLGALSHALAEPTHTSIGDGVQFYEREGAVHCGTHVTHAEHGGACLDKGARGEHTGQRLTLRHECDARVRTRTIGW